MLILNSLATAVPSARNLVGRLSWQRSFIRVALALASLVLCSAVHAVSPPPDGGYPNANTAEGDSALSSLTTGCCNTADGDEALLSDTTGHDNTATGDLALFGNFTGSENSAFGAGALIGNITGNFNTATGAKSLFNNTTGSNNTASGFNALSSNTTGSNNNAFGSQALTSNTSGPFNNAFGNGALAGNTTGDRNTAMGEGAMIANTTGSQNTAVGVSALRNNSTGFGNVAIGQDACNLGANSNTGVGWSVLINNTASNNSAVGFAALINNTTGHDNMAEGFEALANNKSGSSNIALGSNAGINLTTGSNNIDIGAAGSAGESKKIRIGKQGTQTATFVAGIRGATVASGVAVVVSSNGQLGTVTSSARFKEAIKPMDETSETILRLKPVTFHYKEELDPDKIPQFGLIAEQVEKVNPDLVVRDEEGRVNTVRYEAVNAMLLNEFLKEHRKVERLEGIVTQQQKQIEVLIATVQKVGDQVALSRPAPQLVANP
jgi:hypothetical protein